MKFQAGHLVKGHLIQGLKKGRRWIGKRVRSGYFQQRSWYVKRHEWEVLEDRPTHVDMTLQSTGGDGRESQGRPHAQ
jgi:hypothetical protein